MTGAIAQKINREAKMAMNRRFKTRWPATAGRASALALLVTFNSACVGASVESQVDKVSLVDAWNIKMTRHDAGHVLISYQPLMSSALKYPGANIHSDGRTLRVSLPHCLVTHKCAVAVPSAFKESPGRGFWYEVVVPYNGERVLVDGDGPVVEELPLSR
ncbi:hypothetical protein [Hydrogenophaga sp.]|uniref:hypothetical protein n=1 Tax=Hydrogenophaga sp. TaxID=1904254 RepID=UPI0035B2E387